jgi:choline dehydrogenase-like flavoprotein
MGNNGLENFRALDFSEEYDVCIIGSGPSGTVLAKTLVKNGVRTLMLDAGKDLFSWIFDSRMKKMANFEVSGNADYPVTNTRGFLLGGTSNFWTGRCERFHPSDFERHPYTPSENPWPITYDELDPYYEKVEEMLRVRGGERSSYTPKRNKPMPLSSKLDISYLKNIFGDIGVIVDDSPTATPKKAIRFFKVQKEILPEFKSSPNLTLILGVSATRLLTDPNGKVVGAEVRSLDGVKKTARAKVFVVAAGGLATPRLLLLSKSEKFPNGIGNTHDRVGRGFNEHPAVNFYAQVPNQWGTIYPSNKIGRTHQFYNHFRSDGLGSILPVFRQSWVLPHHNMPLTLKNIPRNTLAIFKRFIKATLYIGIVIEMKISDSNRIVLSDKLKDIYGDPLAHLILNYSDEDVELLNRSRELVRKWYSQIGATNIREAQITFSRHHQGTCRMGDNPKASVVDKNLRVHETPNLYLCGSEVFVTGGSMQPCLTLAALASRLGDYLVTRFREGSIQN